MSDTPNEIWCDTGLYYEYKTDWSEGSWRNNDDCGGVKYVRADRIEELEERLKAATDDAKEAEAYVEELEVDNKGLRHMILDQINSTGDDPEIMAATRAEWAARALMAEAKLEKIRTFLDELWDSQGYDARELHDLLKELDGVKDE